MNSDLWTKVIIAIVVLHFIGGFGYLIYKLSPQKGDREEDNES